MSEDDIAEIEKAMQQYDDKLESGKYLLVMNAPNYTKTITMTLIR